MHVSYRKGTFVVEALFLCGFCRLLLHNPVQMHLQVFKRGLLVLFGDCQCQKLTGSCIVFEFLFISLLLLNFFFFFFFWKNIVNALTLLFVICYLSYPEN